MSRLAKHHCWSPRNLAPGMSVIGMFGIGGGDGVAGKLGMSAAGMSCSWLAGGPLSRAAVDAARRARAEHLRDGHQVVAVGLEHRDELLDEVDRRRVECRETAPPSGLDRVMSSGASGDVRVVHPVDGITSHRMCGHALYWAASV